ncbi:MAG: questin oxidase family protein [Pseudomonadales bacterium]
MADEAESALDDALGRLEAFDSELANGLTNHAPMVVEALTALGRSDEVTGWLDHYLTEARPARASAAALDPENWQAWLGDVRLESAWRTLFELELGKEDWREVLSRWLPRLAPGFAAAAAHGPIRTAHAVRSLARRSSPVRIRELAGGLALWAASHQRLPGDPPAGRGVLAAAEALSRVPLVAESRRRNSGSITDALTVLAEENGFPRAVAALDTASHWEALSLEIAEAIAGLFVEQVDTPLEAIVFTHAITGMGAARRLGALVEASTARSLVLHAWQTGCALYAAYGRPLRRREAAGVLLPHDVVDAAVAHGDEHVIKLAEVCVELEALTGNPVFLAAAERCRRAIP